MTGETKPMKKDTIYNGITKRNKIISEGKENTASIHEIPSTVLLSGTKVLDGIGEMIVITVGSYSAIGNIKKLIQTGEDELTPLQLKLSNLAKNIGYFGLIGGILILLSLMIRELVERSTYNPLNSSLAEQSKSWEGDGISKFFEKLLSFFILALSVLVVAIPEGLPVAVTLTLAFSVKKMMKDNNLVRKL